MDRLTRGSRDLEKKGGGHQGKFIKTKNDLFNMGRGNHYKIPAIISQSLKIIIMIMVKISAWGSSNLQYLDMGGVAGQKCWEALC